MGASIPRLLVRPQHTPGDPAVERASSAAELARSVLPHASVIRPSTINLPDLDEPAVIARAVAGDKEACGELYSRYRDGVHRILHHLLRDFPADVDDIASQVFVTVPEQIPTYQDHGRPFASWLHSLIRYRVLEHRNWRRSRREDELTAPTAAGADVMASAA